MNPRSNRNNTNRGINQNVPGKRGRGGTNKGKHRDRGNITKDERVLPSSCVLPVKKEYIKNHMFINITHKSELLYSNAEYYVEDLINMRDMLNTEKSKLDNYYNRSLTDIEFGKLWNRFQLTVDLYKSMRHDIETRYGARHVTNGWMKYWEIYTQFNLIPMQITETPYKAFFNAELPGAALSAFNHYMMTERDFEFDWNASSFVDPTGTALGDIYGYYKANPAHWLMDEENNGDATVLENVLDFEKRLGPNSLYGGVDFYSHDAGLDVSDFNRQEELNAKLHLGCAIIGLLTLKPGGVFIAKQYTYYETLTWNLIIIYASLFDEFYISKPLTSRPYNSEIYLIGKGFHGISSELRRTLLNKLEHFDHTPILSSDIVDSDVYLSLQQYAETLTKQQISMLEDNMRLYDAYNECISTLQYGLKDLKEDLSLKWLKLYPVHPISPQDHLPDSTH